MSLSSDNDVKSSTDKDACRGNISDLENSELNSEAQEEKSESVVDSHNSDNGSNVTSVADVIVGRYNNIKRHTPRVGTLFCPDNKPDGKTGLQVLGSARRTILSAYSLKSIGGVSSDIGLRIENIGLKKYNRYMKSHRPNTFKNLECRSIVGQEDNSDSRSSSLEIKTMSSKEKKLASRPPVVGQASSSSNDSGSFVMDRESSSPVSDAVSCDEIPMSRCPAEADLAINSAYFDDFTSGHQQLRVVSNRDDYINEQPPEGSSEQESLTSQPDLQTELPRIPSPSSASSVASTSVRPLEWDSGADVGYYQMYPPENTDPDSKLSTIERIALARGSAVLLTRSDPEGTTGQNTQLVNQSTFNKALKRKMFLKDRLGAPVAESTPFSLNATSSMHIASGFVSGIEDVSPVIQIQSNIVSDDNTSSSNTETKKLPKKSGEICYQLFPELQKPQDNIVEHCEGAVGVTDVRKNSRCPVDGTGDHSPSNQSSPRESQFTDQNKQGSFGENFCAHGQNVEDSTPRSEDDDLSVGCQRKVKKLSSSMEFLNTKSNLNEKELPYTLPRSQSHSNITGETNSNNIHSLPKSLILRSFNPTKSASSSSISTVVHKKKDSPKRISKLIQTSYIQQSVGTQASGSDLYNAASGSVSYKISDSLRSSSNLSEGNRANERSSYFSRPASINSSNNGTYERSSVQVQSKHTHDGLPCSGAHKKFSTFSCQMSYQKSDFVDRVSQRGSNRSDNVQGRERNYMEGNEFQNVKNCDTLESMESSAKSGQNTWTDRRESMGVEDRVNSFEYLPGHVFENSARKGNDSQGTSSVSLNQNGSSRNDYSDGTDRIWDVSGSASSTLLRDIDRGVHLMNDFVKNSHVTDDHLKQKLIKKVVEKLLKTDYSEDRQWIEDLEKVGPLPWMSSPHHQDVAGICNGRETRRSHTKEIALHGASSSEKSSSRTSSECFRPQSIFIKNSSHPRETAEKCIGTDPSLVVNKELSEGKRPSVQSTSSDAITESNDSSLKPHSTADEVAQQKNAGRITSARTSKVKNQHHISNNKRPVNTSSNSNTTTDRSASVECSSDWRDPVTKAEKLFEEKRKKQEAVMRRSHGGNQGEPTVLLQYLSIERENQLFWIKSEIEHLSNLKRLLEKQEQLKKSLARLKIPKTRSALKAVSKLKHGPEITSSPKESNSYNKNKSERKSHVLTDRNENRSQEYLGSDWSSHHYFSSTQNEKNDRPSKQNEIKSKEKSEVSENELSKRLKKLSVANIHSSSFGTKEQKMSESHNNKNHVLISSCALSDDDDDDDDEVSVRAKKTVGTETTDTIGVQTSKSVQQLPLIKPAWFKNQKKSSKKETSCSCKRKGTCRYCKMNKQKKESKKSVAYFITFDNPSCKYDDLEEETTLLENHAGDHFRNKKIQHGKADVADSDNSSKSSDQKENHEPRRQVTRLRPTLQEYLLRNRADYVSRAEYRRQCVAELAYLRELRDKSKRHLITMAPDSSDYSQSSTPRDLPPPPLAVKRVFTQRAMRRQTEHKYRQLAEVQSRQLDMKRKEAYRTNRLMAEVFTKKLQKRTLKGEVNLSNSVSVISTL